MINFRHTHFQARNGEAGTTAKTNNRFIPEQRSALNVEVGDAQCIFLDELAARFDHVAHQAGEDLVGDVGLGDLDLEQRTILGIERRFPQLLGVHLSKTLVALHRQALVRISHDWADVDALAETDGAAALTVEQVSRETSSASAGFRFGGSAPLAAGLSLEPRVSVAYAHSWGDLAGSRNVRFTTGPGFGVTGARLGKDALDIDIGLDLVTDGGLRVGIGGFAHASRNWADYGAKAGVSLRF